MGHRGAGPLRAAQATAVSVVAVVAVVAVVVAGVLTACSGPSTPSTAPSGAPPGPDAVVVASFNFPESELLAEIYAGALEQAGVPVRRELNLGPRELVEPALQQGVVDLVPEYLGTSLASLEPGAAVNGGDPQAVREELSRALAPWHTDVMTPATAQNQNAFAVTTETAARLHLHSLSDLAGVATDLTLSGPPECPERPYCLIGLQSRYGVHFGAFVPFATSAQRATALVDGVADVAVVFTTDAVVADKGLVLLADDKQLQPAENVVPLVSARALAKYGTRLTAAVDSVSAGLTTSTLAFLNWRVEVAGHPPAVEARAWLQRQR